MKKIKKKCRKYWKPVVFVCSLTIFILMVIMLLNSNLTSFDNWVYKYVTYFKNDVLTGIFKFISFLCSVWFILFITVILMIFSKNKKFTFCIGLNVLLCFLLNQTLKFSFARNRPIDINLVDEIGYSFPSAHSMISLAFYGLFIYIVFHMNITKGKKALICLGLALLTLLMGISRIYLGVHYASDVLAGFALSMAYLIVYINVFYKKIK